MKRIFITFFAAFIATLSPVLAKDSHRLVEVGEGYSGTSVNTAVFRTNSVVTHGDCQYVAYYDPEGYVTLAKRKSGTDKWEVRRSQFKGNVRDGHNIISIGVDGDGYIHCSFDHHGHPLNYAVSVAPGSLELGPKISMTGDDEGNVTYPEFYTLSDGDLIFVYRSGSSGRGNLVMNRFSVAERKWKRVHDILIDGENERNAYWQIYVDASDRIHISWVWRETWLVETNHDLCYAVSDDGGVTWRKSTGEVYNLPITMATAEVACSVPQKSELINQTSMTADRDSHPYIATYWRDAASTVPQYRLVWNDGKEWKTRQMSQRETPFSLSGGGTKMIPISRPRVIADGDFIAMIFRDVERGNKVSMTYTKKGLDGDLKTVDLTPFAVDAWEPSFDTNLWNKTRKLHIFVQHTVQGDGEKALEHEPEPVYILEIDKYKKLK